MTWALKSSRMQRILSEGAALAVASAQAPLLQTCCQFSMMPNLFLLAFYCIAACGSERCTVHFTKGALPDSRALHRNGMTGSLAPERPSS